MFSFLTTDFRVSVRGQMHIRNLRNVTSKISGLQSMNTGSQNYFCGKIKSLCKTVFRDCCIELDASSGLAERAASTNHALYLIQYIKENHRPLPPAIKEKYQQIFSLPQKDTIKAFLSIVPFLIQNIKDIFVEESVKDVPHNGLRGLPKEKLDHFVYGVRNAEGENNPHRLFWECCNILEQLCLENYSEESNREMERWGDCLAIVEMLNFLKPFFQYCPQDNRLHKRLELFSRQLRDMMADRSHNDKVFSHDFSNVLQSLIRFARFDPSKMVRFELYNFTHSPFSCIQESVIYDKLENTFSQVFRVKAESDDELHLHALAHVCIGGQTCMKRVFYSAMQSVNTITGSALSLRLEYRWGSKKVSLDSKDFVILADRPTGCPCASVEDHLGKLFTDHTVMTTTCEITIHRNF